MKRLQQILAIIVAVVLTDAHWAVLQSVAWVEMVSDARADTEVEFSVAIRDVISGGQPCVKCCLIQKELDSDQEQLLEAIAKSGTAAPLGRSSVLLPPRKTKKATFHPEFAHFFDSDSSDIDHPPQV